jgi:hypothetical protein
MLAYLESSGTRADRRVSRRHVLKLRVPGSTSSESGVVVLVHDLSLTGLLIETSADLSIGGALEIELPETGMRQARVVWNSGKYFGCELLAPISKGSLSAALLRNPVGADSADAAQAEAWEGEEKFSPRTRFLIMIALALASWAVVLLIFSLV